MAERQSILPEPCNNFCSVEQIAQTAVETYDSQADQTVAISFSTPEEVVYVRRDCDDTSKLISDPAPMIEKLQDRLVSQPCEFVKTGQCGAAMFLVESALNNKLKQVI